MASGIPKDWVSSWYMHLVTTNSSLFSVCSFISMVFHFVVPVLLISNSCSMNCLNPPPFIDRVEKEILFGYARGKSGNPYDLICLFLPKSILEVYINPEG